MVGTGTDELPWGPLPEKLGLIQLIQCQLRTRHCTSRLQNKVLENCSFLCVTVSGLNKNAENSLFIYSVTIVNKPGQAQVGAISKAQK